MNDHTAESSTLRGHQLPPSVGANLPALTEGASPLKLCRKCWLWKPADSEHFSVSRGRVHSPCRECYRVKEKLRRDSQPPGTGAAYAAKYREAHKESYKESQRRYALEHREERRLYNLAYYQEHKESLTADKRRKRKEDPTREHAVHKAWRMNNPDKVRRNQRNTYLRHREERIANALAYQRAKPEIVRAGNAKIRARKRAAAGSYYTTHRHIKSRWEMWGCKCWMCGKPATCTDHVIPLKLGGAHWPSNLRPACHDCNRFKSGKPHHEFLYHPVNGLPFLTGAS